MTRRAAIVLLALLPLLGSSCRKKSATEGTDGTPIAPSGPQVLAFRGNTYDVIDTYYLRYPEGLHFTIEYQLPYHVDIVGMTDEQAYEVAYPLMRGALDQGWHQRTKIESGDGATSSVSRIGIALYADASRTRARRLVRDVETVKAGP
jgi:hypothetical protein